MTGPDIQPIACQDPFGQDDNVPAVPEESEKRRSTRERKQRTVYDASSGTYVEPRSWRAYIETGVIDIAQEHIED